MITTMKSILLVLCAFVFAFFTAEFSANADANAAAGRAKCPKGDESGLKLDSGLYQLNGTLLKVGEHASNDLPDPAPPFTEDDGSIGIYGSSAYFIRYPTRTDFEQAGCFEVVPLDVRQDNGAGYPLDYTHPWDIRKFRIEPKDKPSYEILVAGAMSRSGSNNIPYWPDDNISRRIFVFRKSSLNTWVRDLKPLTGSVEKAWLGHSYGGNFIQVGMRDPNVIRPDDKAAVAFFYDRVSDDTRNSPYKTEIFATKMQALGNGGIEVPIVGINSPPYPSLKRVLGGFLAEGPRPIEMKIRGQTFFIVAFSSGDFSTDSYYMNYAWSRTLMGPYTSMTTATGDDLLDLGSDIKLKYRLSWMGRPSLFQTKNGDYEMMFHATRKDIRPDNDFTHWPADLLGFFRSIYKVTVDTSLDKNGAPVLKLNPRRTAR